MTGQSALSHWLREPGKPHSGLEGRPGPTLLPRQFRPDSWEPTGDSGDGGWSDGSSRDLDELIDVPLIGRFSTKHP